VIKIKTLFCGKYNISNKLNVVISKDEHGYYAYCPTLPGCHTQADTFEESLVNIKEAIELYIETMTPEEMMI
jgi:predicted RNase H-like HicB family nuclease